MKTRHKKLYIVAGGVAVIGVVAALVLYALRSNVAFSYTPTQVVNQEAPVGRSFRIGGLVEKGSLQREADGLTVHFVLTDTVNNIGVTYKGILPDLFKEGKGAVAQGKLDGQRHFVADEVLAKHDENYMPPEAAQALKAARESGKGPAAPMAPQEKK